MKKKIFATAFTDNMVLQRNKPIKFFGTVSVCANVSIDFNGMSRTVCADSNGKWEIEFPPMKEDTHLTVTAVSGHDTVILTNVAIGEVWLAGGQSNMEFDLARCTDWERIKDNRNHNIRFFYTPKYNYRCDEYYEAFDNATWELTTSNTFDAWSAVAYIFAEHLQAELGVTIGIIGCNWGGTSASAWMSRKAILADPLTRIYIDEFDERNAGIPLAEQKKQFDEYNVFHKEWVKKSDELFAANPSISWDEVQEIIGPCRWPGPINSFNCFRPCGQYDQMLMEICPYTLKGFIYYQGESDDHRPRTYYKLCSNLIRNWRECWGDDSIPFILTQLPMHSYSLEEDFKNWPIIREAQLRIAQDMNNVSIAVIPDCGVLGDIHPTDKSNVGKRLALQALCNVYRTIDSSKVYGPIYREHKVNGSSMEIYFDYAEEGLKLVGEPACYELAGSDKVFHPAKVTISGSSIILYSEEVYAPMYARYCWVNYGVPSLYGTNDLPASPFRTSMDDETVSELGSASIQQIMEI